MKMIKKSIILFSFIALFSAVNAQNPLKPLGVGEQSIMFTLKNAKGKEVKLASLLKKGPVVLTWYRGGWCPFCNIALKNLQDRLPEIKKMGATLVALTPELPDNTLSTKEKNKIKFEVLSDLDNNVARLYGIVFKLSPETAASYESRFGLSKHNGNDSQELPIPATYVIDKNGVIRYAYLEENHRQRADVDTILAALQKLK